MPSGNAAMSRAPGLNPLALVIVVILIFPCLTGGRAPALGATEVVIEDQMSGGVAPYATTYRAAKDSCAITWIAYNNEPGVVKYQQDCPASLAEQLPLLSSICAAFLNRDRNAAAFHTLFWGRLAPDDPAASREMSFRLASAALGSDGWDKRRGQPKDGNINRFTRDLANQARIYPELQKLFADFHLTVTLSSVEKVLVLKVEQLPFFTELAKLGADAADRLPFDCMAWFAVAPDTTDNSSQDE